MSCPVTMEVIVNIIRFVEIIDVSEHMCVCIRAREGERAYVVECNLAANHLAPTTGVAVALEQVRLVAFELEHLTCARECT
jgi:hypothetical protein